LYSLDRVKKTKECKKTKCFEVLFASDQSGTKWMAGSGKFSINHFIVIYTLENPYQFL